jgi:hypothetical protein
MRINKIVFGTLFLLQGALVFGQTKNGWPLVKKTSEGTWKMERYASGIV